MNARIAGSYYRNILILFSGTLIAQLLPILITPILTRLYSPEQFGKFGFMLGCILFTVVIYTLKFEQVIFILGRNRKKVISFIRYMLIQIFVLFLFSLFLILIFFTFFEKYVVYSLWDALIIILGALTLASYTVFRSYLNWNGEYRVIRSKTIKQTFIVSLVQISLGILAVLKGSGLILGDLSGKVFVAVSTIKEIPWGKASFSRSKSVYFIKKYSHFLIFQFPASLVTVATNYLPMILIPFFFSVKEAGVYFLVFKVVMSPISIIGLSFLDVFKVKAQESISDAGNCREVYLTTLRSLVLIGSLIFISLYFFSDVLFNIVFGDSWSSAGVIASIFAPLAAVRFVAGPLSYILILKERLFVNLIFQIILCINVVLCITFADDIKAFVFSYSLISTCLYMLLLLYSYKLSKGDVTV